MLKRIQREMISFVQPPLYVLQKYTSQIHRNVVHYNEHFGYSRLFLYVYTYIVLI